MSLPRGIAVVALVLTIAALSMQRLGDEPAQEALSLTEGSSGSSSPEALSHGSEATAASGCDRLAMDNDRGTLNHDVATDALLGGEAAETSPDDTGSDPTADSAAPLPAEDLSISVSLAEDVQVEDLRRLLPRGELERVTLAFDGYLDSTTMYARFDFGVSGLTFDDGMAAVERHLADSAAAMDERLRDPDIAAVLTSEQETATRAVQQRIRSGDRPVRAFSLFSSSEEAANLIQTLNIHRLSLDGDAPLRPDVPTQAALEACGIEVSDG